MKKLLTFAFVLIFILLISTACSGNTDSNEQENDEDRIVPVEVAEVKTGDFNVEKTVYGRTSPTSTVPVIVQTGGEIDTLYVENGETVDKNERIARIATPMGRQNVNAPTDGEIANLKQEGSMATTEEPIAMIVDTEEMMVSFSVTSRIRNLIEAEDTLPVMISDEEYEIEITSVGTLPEENGLYLVEGKVDNEDEDIIAGLVAELKIKEKVLESTIIIPTEAIVEESDESFVYVVNQGEVNKVIVEVLETQTDKVAIDGELEEGDEVVVSGQLTLSENSKVEVEQKGEES